MNSKYENYEQYEAYEDLFDPIFFDRQARRKRRVKANHRPKATEAEIVAKTADTIGLEAGLQISYQPSRHEAGWLLQSLRPFFDQELISDVEALLKGGKEANVYRCAAHPATGETWLAAKVYRPRMFRNLRNDQMYRQGRPALTPNGVPAKASDTRLMRALGKKTAFGQQVAHTSWLMHEYKALELLHDAGGDVPRAFAASENAILMSYIGDGSGAAPALNEINLDKDEMWSLFSRILDNVRLMLQHGRIHGDLSAYNILYWQGAVTLIDFPQVSNSRVDTGTHLIGSRANPDAAFIFERDVTRICEYFVEQGLRCDAQGIAAELWQRYVEDDTQQRLADASIWDEQGDE
jgi:RIO kinase 1